MEINAFSIKERDPKPKTLGFRNVMSWRVERRYGFWGLKGLWL